MASLNATTGSNLLVHLSFLHAGRQQYFLVQDKSLSRLDGWNRRHIDRSDGRLKHIIDTSMTIAVLVKGVVEGRRQTFRYHKADRECVLASWNVHRVKLVDWEFVIEERVIVLVVNVVPFDFKVCLSSSSPLNISCFLLD